jgi:hypothetical protein
MKNLKDFSETYNNLGNDQLSGLCIVWENIFLTIK